MKHEHKLTPTQVQFVKEIRDQISRLRPEWYMALGRVKELETLNDTLETSLKQQLQLVIADLPRDRAYKLSEDGTMLVGEKLDAAANAAAPDALKPELVPSQQLVNGASHAEE